MYKKTKSVLIALGLMMGTMSSSNAAMIELITNGGFETGDFTGWTTTDLATSSGQWHIDNGLVTPESGSATVGPASGNFYAVTDQSGPGTHALTQAFVVPEFTNSLLISFDMFMNNQASSVIVDPIGLDHTGVANQHARVDILTSTASLFSIDLADVVQNLVAPGADAGANPNRYTSYSFDIAGGFSAGTEYVLRFAETDNQLFFNQGVDNVSVIAKTNTTSVPGPASLGLFFMAFACMFSLKKIKAAR
ncbi:hypothetical protein L0668_09845 [Paraglaciecola aquimarina]|uniref:PEP-CTERM sorting domain-containing protein n=1 Tax=Paraglaciecola algarum TaxID=3050085 RepID=A0ABS9D663_9ALTE|nr:hypothetical protein [Paraglaciecola sp. G1-23]MCF2948408.1 hypothetical protein [Paraglaciecola sp. G1-23]